jgi:hypothetical protein
LLINSGTVLARVLENFDLVPGPTNKACALIMHRVSRVFLTVAFPRVLTRVHPGENKTKRRGKRCVLYNSHEARSGPD